MPCQQRSEATCFVRCRPSLCRSELFGTKPKFHGLHHVSQEMLHALRGGAEWILSPLAFSCESNEDMVGKVSRLARRVSARLVNKRVLDRLMFKSKALFLRSGFSKRKQKPSQQPRL